MNFRASDVRVCRLRVRPVLAYAGHFALCAAVLTAGAAHAADKPEQDVRSLPCLTAASSDCGVPGADLKQARELYAEGTKRKTAGHADEALAYFSQAATLVPRNVEFATAREITRQGLVFEHIERGNALLGAGRRVEALAAFRTAVQLDPSNEFAVQRMGDALGSAAPQLTPGLRRVSESTLVRLGPREGLRDFHFRGDARGLFSAIAAAYGLGVQFDDSVAPRPVRFDLGKATFEDAIAAARRLTRTMITPVDAGTFLVAADSQENRQKFERAAMLTFYIDNATTATELNEVVTMLRTLFEVTRIQPSATNQSITVRGPQEAVLAAGRFIEGLQAGSPQVMLDVRFYEVSRTALRALGIETPLQFQMFNLSSTALAAALAGGGQDLIDQLISSGAINQANSQALQALIAQLQNQQSSLFSTPFATFGGGISRFGVAIPPVTARLSLNESEVRTLEHLTLRAAQNNAATLRIGTRFPILNATFSPIFNTAALSQVIENNSFIAPFPSFSYQDLGITLKATPQVHGGGDVTLKLELQIQALGGQSFNGVPVISNREYSGEIAVRDGEGAVLTGMLTSTDRDSMRGIPGLARIPGVGRVAGSAERQRDSSQLLVIVTPHIVSTRPQRGPMWVLQR